MTSMMTIILAAALFGATTFALRHRNGKFLNQFAMFLLPALFTGTVASLLGCEVWVQMVAVCAVEITEALGLTVYLVIAHFALSREMKKFKSTTGRWY